MLTEGTAAYGGGFLSKEIEDGAGTDVELGWVLMVDERPGAELVTNEEGVLFKSRWVEVREGLEMVVDTKTEVVAAVETVVIFDRLVDAEEEGSVVTIHDVNDPTTVDCPAAEIWEVLLKGDFSRFDTQTVSDLVGGGWVKALEKLWVTCGGLADTAGETDIGLGVLTEAVFWGGEAISEVSLLGQIKGALFIVDGVFAGTVEEDVKLEVEWIVFEVKDVSGAEAAGVVEGFVAS